MHFFKQGVFSRSVFIKSGLKVQDLFRRDDQLVCGVACNENIDDAQLFWKPTCPLSGIFEFVPSYNLFMDVIQHSSIHLHILISDYVLQSPEGIYFSIA